MTHSAHEAAAQYLVAARRRGSPGPRIPQASRPATVEDALAIQARVSELVGQPVGGYKCSVPNEPRPVWMAPIYAPTIGSGPRYAAQAAGALAQVEPEIAFVLARDLPAPASDDEVRAAIKETRLVLEILGSRYADYGKPEITAVENLADNVANQGLWVGPALTNPFERKLEGFAITVRTPAGVFATRDGKHPDGHPLRPLYWLARFLAQRGTPLRAGMIVTTGSYCGIVEVPFDTPLTFEYGDLGMSSVTLTRQ